MKMVFLARPYYFVRDPKSDAAARYATERDDVEVHSCDGENNMTCKNFNALLAMCMNQGIYDYFAILHADTAAEPGFLDAMIDSIEAHDLDATHCPCRYKNDTGLMMTAVGKRGRIWGPNRQITAKEQKKLPKTFVAADLCDLWGMTDRILLPNTGCMLLRLGEWVEKFPGFQMIDQFGRDSISNEWVARSVSEDYWFGHWAADNGLRVGGTNHPTSHVGRIEFRSDEFVGQDTDHEYIQLIEKHPQLA